MPHPQPKIKICCISTPQEAKLAISKGATAIGLVSEMPSGPGVIDEQTIKQITDSIKEEDVSTFLLTSKTTPDEIIQQHQTLNTDTIQLVDTLELSHYQKLRYELPNVKLVQVIHVLDESSVTEAIQLAPLVDYILLDSGNSKLKILGGTGKVHNWTLSKKIVEAVEKPVFLAGGLNSNNVKEAIETVQPYGVDICSGVRTHGKLDEEKLRAFISAINSL